ncbi:MAG: hypothetical protein KKD86_02365, partial [Bacteroidetes bacterium]|nr:hypothetical protein [Bacteroidota bacterium]
GYVNTGRKEQLFELGDVLNNKYRSMIVDFSKDITTLDTITTTSLMILEIVKDVKESPINWWGKLQSFFSEKNEDHISEDSLDNLIKEVKGKIDSFQAIFKDLSKRFEEDRQSIAMVSAGIQVLELCD